MTVVARTLQQLATRLSGQIPGGFAIEDRTQYPDGRPGYRTIELRGAGFSGPVLGTFAEYPTTGTPLHFTPAPFVGYGTIAPLVDALRSHGVVIEQAGS